MLQDLIHPPDQDPIDDISSPISAQIFDFCDAELLPETLQNSEVTSCSNCCYEENSSYVTSLPIPPDLDKFNSYNNANTNINTPTTTTSTNTTNTTTTTATTNTNNSNLSIIFDSPEQIDNDISASIDFSPSPPFAVPNFIANQQDQFDFSSVQPQIPLTDVIVDGLSVSHYPTDPVANLMGPPLPSVVFEEDCLSSVPSYMPLNPSSPSCSFLGPGMGAYMPVGTMNAALSADSSGLFAGGILMGSDLQPQELDYQGDNGGIFCPDSMQRVFNPGDLQVLSSESQQLVGGARNSTPLASEISNFADIEKVLSSESQQLVGGAGNSTPLASEISNLDDPILKVGKLSVEQRKEKILRYLKKRNERNFSKKIKYACRKTLADSRPRVRGRFAKNDDFGETTRPACSNHEEDDDDDVVVKEEEDMVDSSDIFAHISGPNFSQDFYLQA